MFFQAGDLSNCQSEWVQITSNPQILDFVGGVKIALTEQQRTPFPFQQRVPFPYRFSLSEKQSLNEEIQKICAKGIIEPTLHVTGEFISKPTLQNVFTTNS